VSAVNDSLVRRRLNLIRVVALVDALLLVPLVIAALNDAESVARGAAERLWGWWFPAIVVVTLGPPGSLVGDVRIRRRLS
jgi:hypothetical protein